MLKRRKTEITLGAKQKDNDQAQKETQAEESIIHAPLLTARECPQPFFHRWWLLTPVMNLIVSLICTRDVQNARFVCIEWLNCLRQHRMCLRVTTDNFDVNLRGLLRIAKNVRCENLDNRNVRAVLRRAVSISHVCLTGCQLTSRTQAMLVESSGVLTLTLSQAKLAHGQFPVRLQKLRCINNHMPVFVQKNKLPACLSALEFRGGRIDTALIITLCAQLQHVILSDCWCSCDVFDLLANCPLLKKFDLMNCVCPSPNDQGLRRLENCCRLLTSVTCTNSCLCAPTALRVKLLFVPHLTVS